MRRPLGLLAWLVSLAVAASPMTARAASPDDGAWSLPPGDPPPADIGDPAGVAGTPAVPASVGELPPGVYRVTQTYAGDEVLRDGALTRYRTVTADFAPGTYALAIDTVGTGVPSAYDGMAFNGRATLSDGRAVAGTYYETLVLTDAGLVPVNIVFFQDDSELAAAVARSAGTSSSDGGRAGSWRRPPEAAVQGTIGASVSLTSGGAPLRRIEVVRGRPVDLWFGATSRHTAASIAGWRVVSGDGATLDATAGAAAEPLTVRWDRLPPPGGAWRLVVAVTAADDPGAPPALVILDVDVRSPALAP
ncbi:MAG: hypothetical protein ABR525_03480 [Candidatus Limnocylindria bacterium]